MAPGRRTARRTRLNGLLQMRRVGVIENERANTVHGSGVVGHHRPSDKSPDQPVNRVPSIIECGLIPAAHACGRDLLRVSGGVNNLVTYGIPGLLPCEA